jgi:hypothetical protein
VSQAVPLAVAEVDEQGFSGGRPDRDDSAWSALAASDRTRVELELRHLERHGPGWETGHDGITDNAGWTPYLQRYAALPPSG